MLLPTTPRLREDPRPRQTSRDRTIRETSEVVQLAPLLNHFTGHQRCPRDTVPLRHIRCAALPCPPMMIEEISLGGYLLGVNLLGQVASQEHMQMVPVGRWRWDVGRHPANPTSDRAGRTLDLGNPNITPRVHLEACLRSSAARWNMNENIASAWRGTHITANVSISKGRGWKELDMKSNSECITTNTNSSNNNNTNPLSCRNVNTWNAWKEIAWREIANSTCGKESGEKGLLQILTEGVLQNSGLKDLQDHRVPPLAATLEMHLVGNFVLAMNRLLQEFLMNLLMDRAPAPPSTL